MALSDAASIYTLPDRKAASSSGVVTLAEPRSRPANSSAKVIGSSVKPCLAMSGNLTLLQTSLLGGKYITRPDGSPSYFLV